MLGTVPGTVTLKTDEVPAPRGNGGDVKIRIIEADRNEDWWEGFDWGAANPVRHEGWCAFVTAPGSPSAEICDCGVYQSAWEKHLNRRAGMEARR